MKNILFIILLLPTIVPAQSSDLDSVIIKSTTRNVFRINQQQLNELPIHSIDDLLRYMPGIEVQQRGPQGAQGDILLRGGTFQQVLVTIDDIRVNDPLTGHFSGYIPVTISEIDHIEVLYGAASAVYGSEAVGGVIRIFTKAFVSKPSEPKKELSARMAGGEYGLSNGAATANYQAGRTTLTAGLQSTNADGQPQRGIDGYFHITTASIAVKQLLRNDWTLFYQGSIDHRHFAAQNFYTAFASDTAHEKVVTWWNHLRLANKRLSIDVGYKTLEDEYHFSESAAPNVNRSRVTQGLLVYDFTLLKAGFQVLNQGIRSNDRGNHAVNSVATFLLSTIRSGRFTITPAIRAEWNSLSGTELIPQFSMAWRRNGLALRVAAGKATRNADFTERYNNYNKPLVMSGNIGNPALGPERSVNYEAGADYLVRKGVTVSGTYFYKQYSDLLDWVKTPYDSMPRQVNLAPTGTYYLSRNISRLHTSGAEISVRAEWKGFSTVAGLTIINSSATSSLYISGHAKLLFNYAVHYRYKCLQATFTGLYKVREPQAGTTALAPVSRDYFLLNAKADVFLQKRYAVFIQCDNLFDRSYADRFGSILPGRWLMAGLRMTFL